MGDVKAKIGQIADEVASGLGVEVLGVQLLGQGRRTLLRVTLDKPGGVGIDDCQAFSKDLGALLDVEDAMGNPFTLEVSSPGLDRPLKERRDFERHMGELVKVILKEKVAGEGSYLGKIRGATESGAIIADEAGAEVELSYGNILKARLEIEIK